MKIQTISAAVALLATAVFLEGTGAAGPKIKQNISELTQVDKILLRLTHPELYNAWFPRNGGTSKSPQSFLASDYSFIDFLNIDLPTLLLQLSDLGDILLPDFEWVYDFLGTRSEYNFRETQVRNANLTNLNTEINGTNLEIELGIPNFEIISEKFTLVDKDRVTNDEIFWRGLSFLISNYTIRLQSKLEMVTDVGLQLSNTLLSFGVGEFRIRKENATHTFPNGTTEEWGAVETGYAEDLNVGWPEYQNWFENYIETWLNCFLSNGRAGGQCDDLVKNKLQSEHFVQMLQEIGLGIARKQQEVEERIPENEGKTSLLPLLLPGFPLPSIKSALFNLPAFIVQLGKVIDEFYDSEYTRFDVNPLSYDFIRQNCSSGVCHDIHEVMTLPAFGIRGLVDNRIQYDIQPTNFTFSLKVPSVTVDAEYLEHETTDLDSDFQEIYYGAEFTIDNCWFAIAGDYELKEGVGLQVSNIGLTLQLGELQLLFTEYYTIDNGELTEHGELRLNAAPKIMDIWNEVDENGVSFERRYEEYVQNVINSYLNGK